MVPSLEIFHTGLLVGVECADKPRRLWLRTFKHFLGGFHTRSNGFFYCREGRAEYRVRTLEEFQYPAAFFPAQIADCPPDIVPGVRINGLIYPDEFLGLGLILNTHDGVKKGFVGAAFCLVALLHRFEQPLFGLEANEFLRDDSVLEDHHGWN